MVARSSTAEYNRAKTNRWRTSNPHGARRIAVRTYLKRFYGITEERYSEMFAQQNGLCAICELPLISQTDFSRPFTQGQPANEVGRVDHDHKTGKIRGLLCFGCNVGLGKFRDNANLMLKAAGYLRANATPQAQPSGPRESLSEIEPAMGPRFERSRGSRRDELSPFLD